MNYAVFDYDGFICKSFFAACRDEIKAQEILADLTYTAIDKARRYFDYEDTKPILIVSGHSWKKDLYKGYKISREKDPYVSAYRDYIIEEVADAIKSRSLEADELCIMLHDYMEINNDNCIIFSDDKDLKYSSKLSCGINLIEEIKENHTEEELYKQMLAGDKEDDIAGIPKVGMKTAEKILNENGFNIEGVIKAYKDKQIPVDECIKNINLIIPMKRKFNNNLKDYDSVCRALMLYGKIEEVLISRVQQGQLEYLQGKAKEMYQ